MRALKLKMQAFGPFKDELNIDFDKFGNKGIYLISGATGSGKTSIFDAISFALFGLSSGGERDEQMLRYTGTTPDIPTFVELTFEYKNKIYKIKRTPRYFRYLMRGEGVTDTNTRAAEIVLPDGELINNINDVDEYIRNLLGIDANQFSQIAMLAQGNFMALLKASSNEKVELFRKIFLTHKFQELELDIFNSMKQSRITLENLKLRSDEILSNVRMPESSKSEYEEIKAFEIKDIIDFIETLNNIYTEEAKELESQIKISNKDRDKLNETKNKVEEYHKINEELKSLKIKFAEIESDFKIINQRHLKLESKEEERESFVDELKKVNKELEQFNTLDEIIRNKKQTEKNLETANKNLIDKIKNIDELKSEIAKNKIFLDENKETNLKLLSVERDIEKLSGLGDDLRKSLDKITVKNNIEKRKNNAINSYEKHQLELEESRTKYQNIEKIFFESQVGILAKDLVEGEPCPVCGSVHHPDKAILHHEDISEEMVEKSKEVYEKAREKLNLEKENLARISARLETIDSDIEEIKTKFDIEENLEEKLIQKEIELRKKNIELKSDQEKLIKINENIKEIVKINESNEIKLINLSEEKEKYSNEKIKLEANLSHLIESERKEREILGDKSKDEIEEKKKNYQSRIEELRKYIEETRKGYIDINNIYVSTNTRIKSLEERLNKEYDLDLNEINAKINHLENIISQSTDKRHTALSYRDTNIEQIKRIKDISSDINKSQKRYDDYLVLNNLLRGQIRGIKNIRFETFVQIKYFDEILHSANKRFYKMTEGKFSLQRKRGAENLSEQTGLNFEIIDHHNKTERHISTLSGGETFQAALSLALGLSDVVQSKSGGVQLDSMFIDEGFGTLDDETLSKVMSSLLSISQYNKIIGIISHVPSLKEQIDKQIIVEKTPEGHSILKKQIY